MRYGRDKYGRREVRFASDDGTPAFLVDVGTVDRPRLEFGTEFDNVVAMTQEHIVALLPVLAHFTKTGRLPDGSLEEDR